MMTDSIAQGLQQLRVAILPMTKGRNRGGSHRFRIGALREEFHLQQREPKRSTNPKTLQCCLKSALGI